MKHFVYRMRMQILYKMVARKEALFLFFINALGHKLVWIFTWHSQKKLMMKLGYVGLGVLGSRVVHRFWDVTTTSI